MKMTRKECGYAAVKAKRTLCVEAQLSLGITSAQISERMGMPEPEVQAIAKNYYVGLIITLWELVRPLKFPDRRRREDREIPFPKAA